MFIETRGHGPALALIHGWAMHGGLFAPLADRLADRYTLHLVDLPGHGHARDDATPLEKALLARRMGFALTPKAQAILDEYEAGTDISDVI